MLKKWAYNNGYGDLYEEYISRCEEIEVICEKEGLPGNGSTYELQVTEIQKEYPELFGE